MLTDEEKAKHEEELRLAAKGCWYLILTVFGIGLGLFLGWYNQ